jgi:GT2 family glycosyltransferase
MNHVFCLVSTKNTEQFTKLALDSFFKHTKLEKGDIFVFVNNDGTNAFRKDYPIDIYINNKIPKSFSKNFNKGLRIAKRFAKHFVLLTNDIILTEGWFEPLKQKDDCILVPCCNINYIYRADNFKFEFVVQLEDYLGKEKLLDEVVKFHKSRFNFDSLEDKIFIQLYLARIPYQIHSEIGYFDETFSNAGGEDMDFRIRSAIKGYKTMVATHPFVLHFHGKSSWDGDETDAQEEARRMSYLKRGNEKWGKNLTDIFISGAKAKEVCYELGFKEQFDKGESYKIMRILAKC